MAERPKLTPEEEAEGWVVVHTKAVYTELTAPLPIRAPINDFERGYARGAIDWRDRAMKLIKDGSFMEPGRPYRDETEKADK